MEAGKKYRLLIRKLKSLTVKGKKYKAAAREGSWVKRTFSRRAENYTCLKV